MVVKDVTRGRAATRATFNIVVGFFVYQSYCHHHRKLNLNETLQALSNPSNSPTPTALSSPMQPGKLRGAREL